jgi:NAD(P)-dependent dehydrogenase (short-subunit alcohol dehydrogenase family)
VAGEFDGRAAFVTGGGSGIGAAVAARLAAQGARVAVTDLDLDAAAAVADAIVAAGGLALALRATVVEPSSVDDAVDAAREEFGALHLAVNSAGVGGSGALVADCEIKEWHHVLDVDLNGVFYCMRRLIPAMIAAGGGSIVNISSLAGERACARMGPYVAAKHALLGLTRTAALEYGPAGVRINAVAPGPVQTPLLEWLDDATRQAWAAAHPLGRLGAVGDVAAVSAFLLSDRAAMVSGAHYVVDGGLSLL